MHSSEAILFFRIDYSLPCAYALICGRFNITVNLDSLHAQNQGKLASVCLQQFSSIIESTDLPKALKRDSIYNIDVLF